MTAVLGGMAFGDHSDLVGITLSFWTVVSISPPLRGEEEEGGAGVGLSPGLRLLGVR